MTDNPEALVLSITIREACYIIKYQKNAYIPRSTLQYIYIDMKKLVIKTKERPYMQIIFPLSQFIFDLWDFMSNGICILILSVS